MDPELIALVGLCLGREGGKAGHAAGEVRLSVDPGEGSVSVDTADGRRRHLLKPLSALYGKGHYTSPPDFEDEGFMPLLMCIEEAIVCHDREVPDLTDGQVALALSRLLTKLDGDPGDNRLTRRIQADLRVQLSLNDYSRQEVIWALRRVARSVDRHRRAAGVRGYLDFMREFLPGG
jgi:hypothetical protein